MKRNRLLSVFTCLLSAMAYLSADAANVATVTLEDTPLHGSYACTYYTIDTTPVANALGLSAADFAGYSQSGTIKVGTYTSDGAVTTTTNAGADGFSGYWLNSTGVQEVWANGNIFYVYDPAGRIGVGQMPTSEGSKKHCEPGSTVTFHAVYQYNGNEAVVEINYLTSYKVSYKKAKAEAEAALANPDYSAVPAASRTALQEAINANVDENEDAWLLATNNIKQATDAFTGSVTGAGSYEFKQGPGHTSFACSYFNIDNEAIAKVLGISLDEFIAGYNKNASDSKVTMSVYDNSGNLYTATADAGEGSFIGYWMNKKGQRCGWGSQASFYFVYDPAGRIGIGQMPTTQSTGDKVAAGDKITFNVIFKYGEKSATVQVTYILTYSDWLKTLVESTPDYSNPSKDMYYTVSMLNDYNALREAAIAKYDEVATEEEVLAVYNPLKEAADSINVNISLWSNYQKAINKAQKEVIDDQDHVVWTDAADALEEYLEEANENLANGELDNDGLRTEIAKLDNMYKEALKGGVTPGANITDKYLVNADFEVTSGDGKGWTVEGSNVNYGGSDKNHCIEGSNSAKFDVYQTLQNMPIGLYTVKVNGFYRYGNGTSSLTYYADGTAAKYQDNVKVYVNGNSASFKNVYDEKVAVGTDYTEGNAIKDADELYWYPNNMTDAGVAFKAGRYAATTYGVVANADDALRIGVKGSTNQGSSWAIWDNFNVVYEGTEVEAVKPLLTAKIAEVQELLNNGTTYGVEEVANTNDAIATANENVAGTDGEAMFKSLCALIADQESLTTSAEAISKLATQNEALKNTIDLFQEAATPEAVTAATALNTEIVGRLTAKDIKTAEAADYIVKISEATTKLRMPTDPEITDYTSVIINPGYDNDGEGVNSFNGWNETGDTHSFGNSAYQQNALLVEYHKVFDVNQTIYGLPDGKYKVTVNCFSRHGNTSNDYKVWSADNNAENNAYLYAQSGDDEMVKSSIAFISSGAYENAGISGQTSIDGKNVPNDMVSAGKWFDNGYYLNEVTVDVKGGKLTIGVCKFENTGDDWVILDNWTLEYLGKGTGVEAVNEAKGNTVASEIYSIDGMKQNKLTKGVNIIKMTTADGKTISKAVLVK